MGLYRCYNCNKEFWTLRGLKKHCEEFCPRITPTMRARMMKPFWRVISRLEWVDPTQKEPHRENFIKSYMVSTQSDDYQEKLIENAKELGEYILHEQQNLREDKHE